MNIFHMPRWALVDDTTKLSYIIQFGGLQFAAKVGVSIWAANSGVSPRTIYASISRGHFSSSVAKRLVASVGDDVIRIEWLVSPATINCSGVSNG